MKETYYFAHDYAASSDLKLQGLMSEYRGIAYTIYFGLIELLHQETSHKLPLKKYIFSSVSNLLFVDNPDLVEKVIKSCIEDYALFIEEDGYFYSKRVFSNIEKRAEIREKRVKAGRKGGQANAKQMLSNAKAPLEQTLSNAKANVKQNQAKERKGKEKKEKEKENKKDVPTFSEFYFSFPEQYQIDEFGGNAVWQKIYSDDEKTLAVESLEKYKEFCELTDRPMSSPKNYLQQKRYLNDWGKAIENFKPKHEPHIQTEAREPYTLIMPGAGNGR